MSLFQRLSFTDDAIRPARDERVIFVFACGYEKRSMHLFSRLRETSFWGELVPVAFGFNGNRIHSWEANQDLLRQTGLNCTVVADQPVDELLSHLDAVVSQVVQGGKKVRIVIDYSSMPRVWYCALLRRFLEPVSGVSRCDFWYVRGDFRADTKYPCVGFGELHVFAGEPRVTRAMEIHVFGLGFDSTRTYGIWNLLDPQFTCCLIAESDSNQRLVQKVRESNHEILLSANVVEIVRFDDFPRLVAGIVDLARKCSRQGDVCLIADGPKPLVLAMSVTPLVHGQTGVSSWHVRHVKPDGYIPLDVLPSEEILGFRVTSPALAAPLAAESCRQ